MAGSVANIVTIVNELVLYLNTEVYNNVTNCFDCTVWNDTLKDDILTIIGGTVPANTGIIGFLTETIADPDIVDYGFKTQLQRFLDIVKDLKNKITAIQCDGACPDANLLAQLLTTLVMTVTELMGTMEILNGLLAYLGTCGCMGDKFFELMMGKFINALTALQCIVQDWSALVMTFFQFQAMPAKSYVAAYVPKQPMPVPPMQNGGGFACVPCPPRPMPMPPQQCGLAGNCTPFNPYC